MFSWILPLGTIASIPLSGLVIDYFGKDFMIFFVLILMCLFRDLSVSLRVKYLLYFAIRDEFRPSVDSAADRIPFCRSGL
jgi:hypothetical protein